MKRITITLCMLCIALSGFAQATDLVIDNQTPGWLSSKINYGDQQTVKNLTVTGYLNKTDVSFIRSLMSNSLDGRIDLSEAVVVDGLSSGALVVPKDHTVQYLSLPKNITSMKNIFGDSSSYGAVDTLLFDCDMSYVSKGMFGICPYNIICGERVDSIASGAFYNDSRLKTMYFKGKLRTVGYDAFLSSSLSKINMNALDSVKDLGYRAFEPLYLDTLYCPETISTFHASAFSFNSGAHIYFGEHLQKIQSVEPLSNTYRSSTYGFNIAGGSRLNLHFKTMIPPECDVHFSFDYHAIYVPKGAADAYKKFYSFKDANIIEENPITNLSFSEHSVAIDIGQEKQLIANIMPQDADDQQLEWSIADDSIASIDSNGVVTGIASGTTMVYVTSVATGITDSCRVLVRTNVTGISISQNRIAFANIGESLQLTASVLPEDATNQNVIWSSSNTNVCIVSNGLVVSTGFGTAVIMVTTEEGNFMTYCTITVTDPGDIRQDVNGDGTVDSQDVLEIYNYMQEH